MNSGNGKACRTAKLRPSGWSSNSRRDRPFPLSRRDAAGHEGVHLVLAVTLHSLLPLSKVIWSNPGTFKNPRYRGAMALPARGEIPRADQLCRDMIEVFPIHALSSRILRLIL